MALLVRHDGTAYQIEVPKEQVSCNLSLLETPVLFPPNAIYVSASHRVEPAVITFVWKETIEIVSLHGEKIDELRIFREA